MAVERESSMDQQGLPFHLGWNIERKASPWGFPFVLQNSVSRSQTRSKFKNLYSRVILLKGEFFMFLFCLITLSKGIFRAEITDYELRYCIQEFFCFV